MASSVAFKPIDPKRDEFRRYLERAGVIEALTKVVIRLVKERPQNPLEYLRNNLGDAKHEADEYAFMEKELEEARSEIDRLRKIIESVNPDALLEEECSKTTPKVEDACEGDATNDLNSTDEVAAKEETDSSLLESVEDKTEEAAVKAEN